VSGDGTLRVLIIGDPAEDQSGVDFEEEFALRGVASEWCRMSELLDLMTFDGVSLVEYTSNGASPHSLDFARIQLAERSTVQACQYAVLVNAGGFDAYMDAVMAVLERHGLVCPNSAASARVAGDKWRTYEVLRKNRLATPMSECVRTEDEAMNVAERLGYPLVVKDPLGSGGDSVWLANDESQLRSLIAELEIGSGLFFFQQYVECHSRDKRVVLVDDELVIGLTRVARAGDFRSNTSLGGSVLASEVTDVEAAFSRKVASALGLRYAKLDIAVVAEVLPGRENLPLGTPFCFEANAMAGLVRFDKVEGVVLADIRQDIRSRVVSMMERVRAGA
jgi:RimK family alpha-L-glutamate ligase